MQDHTDLAILGGGPAGAVSAWLAAQEGLRVALIDPCQTPARIEGLSPRLHHWLQTQGLLVGFDGLIGPLPRRSLWAGIDSSHNGEFLVCRAALDAHLRHMAVQAGARLIQGSGKPQPGGVVLADGTALGAGQVLDARGRRAQTRSAAQRGPATLAIGAWLSAPRSTPLSTVICPLPQGWLWLAVTYPGRAWAQLTVDAASPLSPRARLRAALRLAEGLPEGLHLTARPLLIREAAPVLSPPPGDLAVIPVGDASAAMDPLSGHGQFWAVSNALAVAAARRTRAARPGAQTDALILRFLHERSHDTYLRQARLGRDFLRLEPRFHDQPFWRARQSFPDDLPSHAPAHVAVMPRVVVRAGLLVEMEVLITPASPGGVGWMGQVPAAEAWRQLEAGAGAAQLIAQWGPSAAAFTGWLAAQMQGPGAATRP